MKLENKVTLDLFKGLVLIVPSISIGNIPQLATDLLIHTLNFVKVATLDATFLYPFASPVDHVEFKESKGVSHALEVYHSEVHKLCLIQQRSPILPGFAQQHVTEVLVPFVQAGDFKQVLFLDLADAGLVEHSEIAIHVYSNEDLLSKSLNTLQLSEPLPLDRTPDQSAYGKSFIDGVGGVAKLSVLVTNVYEGDNFYDARVLAAEACKVLLVEPGMWETPVSWLGVYGDKPVPLAMEEGLYG